MSDVDSTSLNRSQNVVAKVLANPGQNEKEMGKQDAVELKEIRKEFGLVLENANMQMNSITHSLLRRTIKFSRRFVFWDFIVCEYKFCLELETREPWIYVTLWM